MLAELRHLAETLNATHAGTRGQVVVGTLISASAALLPEASARLRRGAADVVVTGRVGPNTLLFPLLARGEMQCVGATTLREYHKYIEKDAALERRFQPVSVGEPTKEESVELLRGLRDRYEAPHRLRITAEAI